VVSIFRGLNIVAKEYDGNGNEMKVQGRESDTRYVADPVIEVLSGY